MPNITVRAAAEGMPEINRRRLLNLTGAGLALAATSATLGKASAASIDAAPAGRAKASPELVQLSRHTRERALIGTAFAAAATRWPLAGKPQPQNTGRGTMPAMANIPRSGTCVGSLPTLMPTSQPRAAISSGSTTLPLASFWKNTSTRCCFP